MNARKQAELQMNNDGPTQTFRRVILYARHYRVNQGVSESLSRIIEFLATQSIEVVQDADTASSFSLPIPVITREQMQKHSDLIVVVGGDGSMLSAARMAIEVNVPVVGINRGSLGFLTDILPQDIETHLQAVLEGYYTEEKRFLLRASIDEGDAIVFESNALNDVVLHRGNTAHLIEFDVLVNHQLVGHFRSDGLILATPTGSTAYALSAGGPIMHPQLNAVVLVPMFSHSLSSRPLVINADSQITLHISECNETELRLSCDGHEAKMVKPGQSVLVHQNGNKLRLLHPFDYHYYDTLRSKLGWESKHQG